MNILNLDVDIFSYSLRPILLFASMDVSRHILELDTSILMKSNMGRREYMVRQNSQSFSLTKPRMQGDYGDYGQREYLSKISSNTASVRFTRKYFWI
jgi:hypothetical protein